MSQKEINDALAHKQEMFEIDLKNIQTNLKQVENPTDDELENLHTVEQYLKHVDSCKKDDCEIHEKIDGVNKEWAGLFPRCIRWIDAVRFQNSGLWK